jgi:hypothetical protein
MTNPTPDAPGLQLPAPAAWMYEELAGRDDVWVDRIKRGRLPCWETRNVNPLYTAEQMFAFAIAFYEAALLKGGGSSGHETV